MSFTSFLKKSVKKILGKNLLSRIRPFYHGFRVVIGSLVYFFPARKMKLVGITGTKGKTSTTTLTGRLFNKTGLKTGYISTAVINTGDGEVQNPYKMTTIDGFLMQKLLAKMVKNGCKVVVLEMSSQGLEQNRHFGLKFAIGVFLNLYPEHLEAHGSLENYRNQKAKLFTNLQDNGVFVGNGDDENTDTMWKKATSSKKRLSRVLLSKGVDYKITTDKDGVHKVLIVKNSKGHWSEQKTNWTADFEIVNTVFAVNIASLLSHKDIDKITPFADNLGQIPGRMEKVYESKELDVLVDYAHEPESMKQLLENLNSLKSNGEYSKIIHIVSCDGVGRDDWKKPILGKLSYEKADFTVVTTDNYEEGDNPNEIVSILSQRMDAKQEGVDKKFIKIVDRKKAFEEALKVCKKYTLSNQGKKIVIVSTGVGNENGLTQPSGKIEWDEKGVWEELCNGL